MNKSTRNLNVKSAQDVLDTMGMNVNVQAIHDEEGWSLTGTYDDMYGPTVKMERLDKYFSLEIFLYHFIARKDYIKASMEIKENCFNNSIHPEQYKIGKS